MWCSLRGALRLQAGSHGTHTLRRNLCITHVVMGDPPKSGSESGVAESSPEETEEPGLKNLNEPMTHPDEFLSRLDDYREDLDPVAKSLFLGKLDQKILSFPDVLQNDRYFSLLARCKRVKQHFEDKKEMVESVDKEGRVSKEILLPLKTLGGYGMQASLKEGGQGLGVTEAFKVTEEFGVNLSVSRTLVQANTLGHRAISRWGTQALRDRLVHRLNSGELTGAVCMADEASGSDPFSTKTRLRFDEERGCYVLNGEKTWVTNAAAADVFTVFAVMKVANHVGEEEQRLVAVAVERNTKGVFVGERLRTVGLKGVQFAPVTFKDVLVPTENLLGNAENGTEIASDTLVLPRMSNAVETFVALRTLYDKTVQHTLHRKAFGRFLCDFDIVKDRLAHMAVRLYALESMLYMTAGLADVANNPSLEMESSMCKLYATQTAREVLQGCTNLYGGKSYLEDSPLHALVQDLRASEIWEGSEDLLRAHIGLVGVQHYLKSQAEHVSKLRDFFASPMTRFVNVYHRWREYHSKDPKLKLRLYEGTHPSLMDQAKQLEKSLLWLEFAVETGLSHHGMNLPRRELDLSRLADSATTIYAMVAALSRASKSYSIGHQDCEHDIELVTVLCAEGAAVTKEKLLRVCQGYYDTEDFVVMQAASHVLDRGRYAAEHPTTKNVF